MAGEIGAISAVDAGGAVASVESQADAIPPEEQVALDETLDAAILNLVFFSFSMMQTEISNGMRQNSSFLSEIGQDSSD